MSNVKVSVIIPMYKSELFLFQCLDSICSQTLKEIEIILINDGSPDNSGKIAEEYAKRDHRIHVIHQPNSGPGVARNKGIEAAKGEYVGFVDSDDWIEPVMYEKLYDAANTNNAQLAMCNYFEEQSNPIRSFIISHPFKDKELLGKKGIVETIISSFATDKNFGYYSLCNKVYKRNWILEKNLKVNEERSHGEDWWFNLEVFSTAERVTFSTGNYYHYMRNNPTSLMSIYREEQFGLFLSGRKHLFNILRLSHIDISESKTSLDKRFIEECVGCIYKEVLFQPKWNKAYRRINEILSNDEFKYALESYKTDSLMKKILILLLISRYLTCVRAFIYFSEKTKSYLYTLKNIILK
jgi:glycosyltransferase involved in cell wall biosynthesis